MTSTLNAALKGLGIYNKILVTGPQRSGTTIASQIIAAEVSKRCIDERDYGYHDPIAFRSFVESEESLVIQCPNFAHIIERFASESICVVFMHRDPRAIIASQKRVDWKSASYQRRLYRGKVPYVINWLTPICVIKILYWHLHQKFHVIHSIDLAYEDLSQHRLWIDSHRRQAFAAKQTR